MCLCADCSGAAPVGRRVHCGPTRPPPADALSWWNGRWVRSLTSEERSAAQLFHCAGAASLRSVQAAAWPRRKPHAGGCSTPGAAPFPCRNPHGADMRSLSKPEQQVLAPAGCSARRSPPAGEFAALIASRYCVGCWTHCSGAAWFRHTVRATAWRRPVRSLPHMLDLTPWVGRVSSYMTIGQRAQALTRRRWNKPDAV